MAEKAGGNSGVDATKAVELVLERIEEVIRFLDWYPAGDLHETMRPKYSPGFAAAFKQVPDFWTSYGEKVLRMAGFAGAVAAFFAEREQTAQFPDRPLTNREVTVPHLMMAMGVIRSACLVGEQPKRQFGIPCNRRNFPIDKSTADKVTSELKKIIQHVSDNQAEAV
jgi:hypothetical protein